jgi:hypothetical protein
MSDVQIEIAGKSSIFRCSPPWDTVLQVFQILQLPTEFPTEFQRNQIQTDYSDSAVALLEPYYKPAKAKQYLEYTDEKRWCTILRQILQLHGWTLLSREMTRDRKKLVLYSVEHLSAEALNAPVQVSFL